MNTLWKLLFMAATLGVLNQMAFAKALEGDTLRTNIIKRLPSLNHTKLQALMKRVGKKAPKNFYNCLCRQDGGGAAPGVGVSYHPEPLKPYNEEYICNSEGPPCMASGWGCWRFPLPSDSKIWNYCVEHNKYDDNSTIVDVIAGAVNGIHKEQKKAREEKKARDLKNKNTYTEIPSEVDDYAVKLNSLMTKLRLKGYPMNKIEKLNAMMRRHLMRLDAPGQLPGFWETLGLSSPPRRDARSLEKWRKGMLKKYDKQFLKMLESGSPLKIASGMRKYSKAMGHFDQSVQFQAEGALEKISANQTQVKDILETVPYIGGALGSFALIGYLGEKAGLTDSHNWTLNGDQVTALNVALLFAGQAGPVALKKFIKSSPNAQLIIQGVGEMEDNFGKSAKKVLKGILGGYSDKVKKGFDILVKERHLIKGKMDDTAENAVKEFRKSSEGIADAARYQADEAASLAQLKKLESMTPGTPEYKKLVLEIQTNKTAQGLINPREIKNADGTVTEAAGALNKEARKAFNETTKKIYKSADEATGQKLKKIAKMSEGDIDAIAKKMGIDPQAMKDFKKKLQKAADDAGVPVESLSIKPNDFSGNNAFKVGRDRDVTFQIVNSKGKVLKDVDYLASKNLYEQNIWKETKGKLPMKDGVVDMAKVSNNAEDLDQAVTSAWHPESYAYGETPFDEFIKGKGEITHVEAVVDTINYKSDHWFKKAAKSTNPVQIARDTAEGMRQATKQWKRIIQPKVSKYYGDLADVSVPPNLAAGLDIFKKVENRIISPKEAEIALEAIGMTKEKVVSKMGKFLEGMEKTAGLAHRITSGKQVENAVHTMMMTGQSDSALSHLKNALNNGDITQSKFKTLRNDIFKNRVKTLPSSKAVIEWANSAYTKHLISKIELLKIESEHDKK